MMMFIMHVALFLGLIALSSGAFIYVWAARNEGFGSGFAKLLGILIVLACIADGVWLGLYSYKFWEGGYLDNGTNITNINIPRGRRR